ncbi:MAG TPA: nucleotide exchange factor GrpE [Patescibacteria group bacterium]|nr:nucleotide exchange factor GrpE [Patescibacteria group bacterium]
MHKKTKTKGTEVDLLKAQLVRALADYDNLIKRVEREKNDIEKLVSLRLLLKLLLILDGLESAQEHLKDQGLAISISEYKRALAEEGLTEIKPKVGDEFDHEIMEVVEVTGGGSDNKISEVVLAGWKYSDGTVVRHAKVKVTKK